MLQLFRLSFAKHLLAIGTFFLLSLLIIPQIHAEIIDCHQVEQSLEGKSFDFYDMIDDSEAIESQLLPSPDSRVEFTSTQNIGSQAKTLRVFDESGKESDLSYSVERGDSGRCVLKLNKTPSNSAKNMQEFFEIIAIGSNYQTLWMGNTNTYKSEIYFYLE